MHKKNGQSESHVLQGRGGLELGTGAVVATLPCLLQPSPLGSGCQAYQDQQLVRVDQCWPHLPVPSRPRPTIATLKPHKSSWTLYSQELS